MCSKADETIDFLFELLKDPTRQDKLEIRKQILAKTEQLTDPEPIVKYLHGGYEVSTCALQALEQMKTISPHYIVDYLVEQFYRESADRGDKVDIVYALRDHKNTASLQFLIHIAKDIQEHEAIRALALQSIGIATRKQIIDPLFDILTQDVDYLTSELVYSVFEALEIMTEDSAIMTEDIKGTRQRIIEILRLHNAFDERVVLHAIIYLGKWRCREAFEEILTYLDSEDPDFRCAAAKALGNIGDTRAIPKMISMINDPNEFVRGAVSTALEQLQIGP